MQEYLLKVEGMTCHSCVAIIKNVLTGQDNINFVDVDLLLKTACVQVDNDGPSEQDVIEQINELGFSATSQNKTKSNKFYFSLKGLEHQQDLNNLIDNLKEKFYVEDCRGNFATQTLIIKARATDKAQLELIPNLVRDFIKKSTDSRIEAEQIHSKLNQNAENQSSKHYFSNATLNLVASGALMFAKYMGWILAPLTPAGQIMGLGLGLGTLGLMYVTGREYYYDAYKKAVKHKTVNMNTLITLGTGSAWVLSMLMVATPGLFLAPLLSYHLLPITMILGILNLGRGFRAKAQKQAEARVQSLLDVFLTMQPQFARKLRNGEYDPYSYNETEQLYYDDIKEGDIVEVLPHERFPVDGKIINEVVTQVNQDNITGEATPCEKRTGDEVSSGSENIKQTVYIQATKDGKDGMLARIIKEVSHACQDRTTTSRTVDKIARVFVPAIIALSALTAVGWGIFGSAGMSWMMINGPLSVLLCACPCALALATPISMTLGVYEFLNQGILVREASKLEKLAETDNMCVVFDKTGTLTNLTIHQIAIPEYDDGEVVSEHDIKQFAASIERHSSHPIAKALASAVDRQDFLDCEDITQVDQGISAFIKDKNMQVVLGNKAHLRAKEIDIPESIENVRREYENQGLTCIFVSINGVCRSVIGLQHHLRTDAEQAIEDLKKLNITPYILTGDNDAAAKAVAAELKIPASHVLSQKSEKDKAKEIIKLKQKYDNVVMVGDGVNDLEATKAADVGIAVGTLTQNSAAASISLRELSIGKLIIGAKAIQRNIRLNLYWTGFYNSLSITCAMGLLYPFFGFALNPVFASLGMAMSSVFVVLNSTRVPSMFASDIAEFNEPNFQRQPWYQRALSAFNPYQLIQSFRRLFGKDKAKDPQASPTKGGAKARAAARAAVYSSPTYTRHMPSPRQVGKSGPQEPVAADVIPARPISPPFRVSPPN